MPTATDLVTDLPADFEVFGQAVATSMADLLGGTSGQILAKNSNTDMDFVWIANDQGDITGITATAPLTGGGSSGAVTVGIQDALTTQKGAVQLSDSTSTTSSILAATPTAVKSAYDLAAAAIPKSLIDAAGDLIVGTAADTAGRLAIGTANQVLKVNSGATALEWGTAGGGGKVLQVVQGTYSTATTIASTTFTDTGLSLSITPTLNTSKILVIVNQSTYIQRDSAETSSGLQIVRGATTIFTLPSAASAGARYIGVGGQSFVATGGIDTMTYLDSPATTSATTYKTQGKIQSSSSNGLITAQPNSIPSTITLLEIGA